MEFKTFIEVIGEIANKVGTSARVAHDEENGLYIAKFPGGIKATGNSISKRITVRWGNSHQSVFEVA